MAEYVEVMNQKRRMCNSYVLCSMGCPLNDTDFCGKNSREKISADFLEVERRTMAWAAEHPEPVYPTWEEWLITQGVIKKNPNGGVGLPMPKLFERISADTAQLLGIEPVPVVHGDCLATNEADARKKLGIEPLPKA